jgi:hypothetical protein
MALLDGDVAEFFSSAFSGFYLDATLHRPAFTDDGAGGGSTTWADEAVKVQPEATTQAMRDSPGYVDTDRRFLMLAHGVAEPTTDCELTLAGQRWAIANWSRDPAGAYYDLHGRKAG